MPFQKKGVANDARKWWEVDATDFRLSRNGGGSMLAAAHSLQKCPRATMRRRRLFAYHRYRSTPMGVHMLARCGRRCDRFSTIEKRWCRMPHTVCESAEEQWRDGAGCLPTSGDTRVLVQVVSPCACACVYMCACPRPWVRACACVRVNVRMCVFSEMNCGTRCRA